MVYDLQGDSLHFLYLTICFQMSFFFCFFFLELKANKVVLNSIRQINKVLFGSTCQSLNLKLIQNQWTGSLCEGHVCIGPKTSSSQLTNTLQQSASVCTTSVKTLLSYRMSIRDRERGMEGKKKRREGQKTKINFSLSLYFHEKLKNVNVVFLWCASSHEACIKQPLAEKRNLRGGQGVQK